VDREVMNLRETAAFLGVSRQRLSVMIREGKTDIPHKKIGEGTYRFARSELVRWLGASVDISGRVRETVQRTRPQGRQMAFSDASPASPRPRSKARQTGAQGAKRRQFTHAEIRHVLRELETTYQGNVSACSRGVMLSDGTTFTDRRSTVQAWLKRYGSAAGVPEE